MFKKSTNVLFLGSILVLSAAMSSCSSAQKSDIIDPPVADTAPLTDTGASLAETDSAIAPAPASSFESSQGQKVADSSPIHLGASSTGRSR